MMIPLFGHFGGRERFGSARRLGGDADVTDTRLLAGVHDMNELLKGNVPVGGDGEPGLGRVAVAAQEVFQAGQVVGSALDADAAIVLDLDGEMRVREPPRAAGAGQLQGKTLVRDHLQGDHDEKNQQKKHDIDHGNDFNACFFNFEIFHVSHLSFIPHVLEARTRYRHSFSAVDPGNACTCD